MSWDRELLDAVNPDQPLPALDVLMVVVTLCGYVVPYALLGFFVISRRDRRADAIGFWAAVLVAEALVAVLKVLVDRPRPDDVRLLISLSESPSMPSGHAARAFAGALALWRLGPRWRLPTLVFGVATLVSRVYVGAHYPSDVLVGAAIGSLVGLAAYFASRWVRLELAKVPEERRPIFVRASDLARYALELDYFYSLRLLGRLTQEQSARLKQALRIWGEVRLLAPLAMILFGIVLFAILLPQFFAPAAQCLATYFVPLVGIASGIPLCLGLGVPKWLIIASIVYLDVWLSLFLILNFDFLHKIPRVGRWLVRREERGRELLLRRPWLMRLEFVGVALVTFTPLPGGGLVPGTLIGRFIGLPRIGVWGSVMVGVVLRISLIVYAFDRIFQWLR